MATTSATLSSATTLTKASVSGIGRNTTTQRKRNLVQISGLNSFGGLKACNSVATLGLPVCTEQSFAKVISSLKGTSSRRGGGGGGGALTSTCNAAAEIFQIVLVMNGLTLVGVAVGFLLLRIEAFVEESEE